ncbi:RNA polymerase sigma factor [Fimbriiglobus ruber]|uniref:RNA polymerase sigma factor n=1 Tax=Fimbriiglobus ruber TaxID=1908690 RepID=A0A225D9A7_9BACT|nr:sigma-70 family RNA polymerase sigma factor [Fimbriiglobus ruber]OWK38042.1 RNA polymerase sigma factor [Fimbriiglobus ruber]
MADEIERVYERTLILRCQAGDREAFGTLVARYGPRLRYYLRKLLGDPDRAEDALQDVWFGVFRGLPKLADPAAFPAWVYRIARDRAAREFRQPGRPVQSLSLEDVADADDRDFPSADAEAIHAALDQLAIEYREVLVLRFLEGMSCDTIARVTGCPAGTVRSRLHYAKRALRGVLTRETRR